MKRAGVVVLLAVFAVGGCSAQPPLKRDQIVGVAPAEGGVVISVVGMRGRLTQWQLDDSARILSAAAAQTPLATLDHDCVGHDCYRVQQGQYRVEESHDGGASYGLSYEVAGNDYDALTRTLGGRPEALGVAVKPVTRGHVVFVAAGLDGVLYRGSDRRWRRMGVPRGGEGYYWEPTARLASEPAPPDRGPAVGLGVFLIIAAIGLIALLIRGALQSRRVWFVLGLAAIAGVISWVAVYFPDAGMFPGALYAAGIITLVITLSVVAIVVLAWRTPPRFMRLAPPSFRQNQLPSSRQDPSPSFRQHQPPSSGSSGQDQR
jgi:hypothetical protein